VSFNYYPLLDQISRDTKISSSPLEDSLPRTSIEEVASLPYYGTLPYDCTPIVPGPMTRHAAWPPLIMRIEKLGYIVDSEWYLFCIPSLSTDDMSRTKLRYCLRVLLSLAEDSEIFPVLVLFQNFLNKTCCTPNAEAIGHFFSKPALFRIQKGSTSTLGAGKASYLI